MGLINENTGKRITVNVGENTYELKTMISAYERREIDTAGFLMEVSQDQFSKGLRDDFMLMRPNVAARELKMLRTYLVSWSHTESLSASNIKRLPPRDWDALIDKINEVQKEQYGPAEDSELGE